jgi:DNA polymerase-3 subunit alpha
LAVKNVGSEITKAIIEERSRNGEFKNFEDFILRIKHKDLNKKSIESLIKSGAFDSLGIERKQALENIDDILKFVNASKRSTENAQNSLFGAAIIPPAALKLKPTQQPATNEEKLAWEKELIGFYLSEHPMTGYTEKINAYKAKPIADLMSIKNERLIVRTAGLVSKVRKIFTKNGQPMIFATIEDAAQKSLEVVVFTSVLEKTAPVWNENNVIIVQGRMSVRDGQAKMICDNAKRLEA